MHICPCISVSSELLCDPLTKSRFMPAGLGPYVGCYSVALYFLPFWRRRNIMKYAVHMYLNPALNKQSFVLYTCFECSSTSRCREGLWHAKPSSKNQPRQKPADRNLVCCLRTPRVTSGPLLKCAHHKDYTDWRLHAHTSPCMEETRRLSDPKKHHGKTNITNK